MYSSLFNLIIIKLFFYEINNINIMIIIINNLVHYLIQLLTRNCRLNL